MANRNEGKVLFSVLPLWSRDHLVSGFVQDRIQLLDLLRVTIGTKVERNDFSGTEVQPSGRAAWHLSSSHMIWGAVSRAVRVPTRLERDVSIFVSDPAFDPVARLQGNPSFEAERLVAFEAGHRWQPVPGLSTDLAAFYNRYRGLASLEIGDPFFEPESGRTIIPVRSENLTSGRASGFEALVTYSPIPTARFTGSYAHLDLRLDPEGADLNRGRLLEGATPRHQMGLRSSMDLPARFQVDALFRHVSEIRQLPLRNPAEGVPGYSELNLRIAWLGWRQAEISLVAHDLLHARHPEFGLRSVSSEVERGVYGRIAWGF
jgi:iron complex outermembrane receptor protein